jgi:hypothetical protein
LTLLITSAAYAQPPVRLLRTPDSGIQPQLAVGPTGTRHLLYFKGDPRSGDLFYSSCSKDTTEFAPGIRVNSIDGAACAFGNMRGGQIAFAPDGSVHVAWNGTDAAAEHLKGSGPARHPGEPMLYTRSNADRNAFEPERDLMSKTRNLDGGGGITIANDGRILVVWHASAPDAESKGEPGRQVFIASSADRGVTFSAESPIAWPSDPLGACGCCALKAFAEKDSLFILFRSAGEKVHRDTHLLTSTDSGRTFADKTLGTWNITACPMTTSAITSSPGGPLLAWEAERNVYWSRADSKPITPPGFKSPRKFPSIAINPKGEVLLAWCEGMTFGQSGSLHWQVFSPDGNAIEHASGSQDGVPAWSLITAFAEPDGSFAIIY